jgi:DNA-binding NtrC family response regulator
MELLTGANYWACRPGKLRPLREVEREYILAALHLNNRNQTQTARPLEIGSATLYRKLKAYCLTGRTG